MDNDRGDLFLDGTAVQKVVFSDDHGLPSTRPPRLRAFEMKQKGPKGEQLAQDDDGQDSWEKHEEEGKSYRISEQKFELDNCPLEDFLHSHS